MHDVRTLGYRGVLYVAFWPHASTVQVTNRQRADKLTTADRIASSRIKRHCWQLCASNRSSIWPIKAIWESFSCHSYPTMHFILYVKGNAATSKTAYLMKCVWRCCNSVMSVTDTEMMHMPQMVQVRISRYMEDARRNYAHHKKATRRSILEPFAPPPMPVTALLVCKLNCSVRIHQNEPQRFQDASPSQMLVPQADSDARRICRDLYAAVKLSSVDAEAIAMRASAFQLGVSFEKGSFKNDHCRHLTRTAAMGRYVPPELFTAKLIISSNG